MGIIALLDANLANQIAAGEVVERPASIAKELIENAVDAGAKRIDIAIELGGLALVEVSDDGCGMEPDDAVLATQRHATSKIRHVDDLSRIETFGFRGEALPSIASVSKLTLITRSAALDAATSVTLDGGEAPLVEASSRAVGTTVSVHALFWNVPARRKFLKSISAESAAVGEVVLIAAMSRPEVAFHFLRDGKTVRKHVPVNTLEERVRDVLADDTLAPVRGSSGSMRFQGWLSVPERARSGATGLFCFVNGRPVRDRHLTRAIQQAYGSVLEPGRYPTGAFFLEIPRDHVDVNVHPQKAEVRFADGRAVYEAVTRALHLPLAGAFNLPVGGPLFRRPMQGQTSTDASPPTLQAPEGRWNFEPSRATKLAESDDGPWGLSGTPQPPHARTPNASELAHFAGLPAILMGTHVAPLADQTGGRGAPFGPPTLARRAPDDLPYADDAIHTPRLLPATHGELFTESKGFYASLRYVGQVRRMFLLCEGADGLYILDQHAAAERVTFDRLRKSYGSGSVAMQPLLIPVVLSASPGEVSAAEVLESEGTRIGLELGPHGPSAIVVRAVPAMLRRVNPEVLARDLMAEWMLEAQRPFADRIDMVFATMACHGSLRGGDAVSENEARALLESLDGVDFGGHCPHGRPVVSRLSFSELDRRVGRP